MWVQFLYWIKCGSASRSILTAFRLGLKFGKSIYFSFFFRRFRGIYLTLKLVSKNGLDWVWNFSFLLLFRNLGWRTFDLGFSVGAAISLTFGCFWIVTRVYENHFLTFLGLFFHLNTRYILHTEINVGTISILNQMWKRPFRSLLTAFRFGLKFGKSHFFSIILPSFPGIYLKLELVWKNGLDWVWNFRSFCCFELWVGGPLILDLAWERLSRSLLTDVRFWLEFRKTIFRLFRVFSDIFSTWK